MSNPSQELVDFLNWLDAQPPDSLPKYWKVITDAGIIGSNYATKEEAEWAVEDTISKWATGIRVEEQWDLAVCEELFRRSEDRG